MRDPERLSSSNGISDFERELIDAGKNDAVPDALREQMERALGFSGGAVVSAPVRARVEAATGVKASALVWISAGVVVLGVVGGLVGAGLGSRFFGPHAAAPPAAAPVPEAAPSREVGEASHARSAAAPVISALPATPAPVSPVGALRVSMAPARVARPSRTSPARGGSRARRFSPAASGGIGPAPAASASDVSALSGNAPSRGPSSPSPATPNVVPNVVPNVDPNVVPNVGRVRFAAKETPRHTRETPAPPRDAVASADDLRVEIDLIDGARAALRGGSPSRALEMLGRYAVRFPHGSLVPEETALRVEALMRMGRTAEARAYARRFVAANPASPLAARMQRLANGDATP